jgi:hypothetical protein
VFFVILCSKIFIPAEEGHNLRTVPRPLLDWRIETENDATSFLAVFLGVRLCQGIAYAPIWANIFLSGLHSVNVFDFNAWHFVGSSTNHSLVEWLVLLPTKYQPRVTGF